jgi:HEAT repeat protein
MMLQKGFFVTVLTLVPVSLQGQDRPIAQPTSRPIVPWTILRQGLVDGSTDHRRQALLAAGSIGATPEVVKFIEEGLLRDKDTLVRQTAAAVLGQLKATESIPPLKQAMDDKNIEVAFSAAKALAEMGDTDGREFLIEVLTGERKGKPGFVAQNLKHAKKQLTPTELALMGAKEAAGVLFGPAAIGIVVVEKAVKGGKSDGVSGRTIAVAELATHPDDHTRKLLEWALTDDDMSVRAAAARELGACGNSQTIPRLQTAMNDEHAAVRYMAAASVIRLTGHAGSNPTSSAELK